MSNERWKKVRGWPYEVSDYGRVRSIDRVVKRSDGQFRFWRGRVLRPGISKQLGYPTMVLCNQGWGKATLVHLLVAVAFLPPRPDGHEINHKDGDKANPHHTNLEWITHSENARHSIMNGSRKIFKFKNRRTGKIEERINHYGTLSKI